jgi:NIL domain-containing protein
MKKRIFGNFPPAVIKEPILSQTLPQMFQVKTNIRGASIADEIALVYVDVEGSDGEVEKAIEYLRSRGVTVKEVDPNAPISRPPMIEP